MKECQISDCTSLWEQLCTLAWVTTWEPVWLQGDTIFVDLGHTLPRVHPLENQFVCHDIPHLLPIDMFKQYELKSLI